MDKVQSQLQEFRQRKLREDQEKVKSSSSNSPKPMSSPSSILSNNTKSADQIPSTSSNGDVSINSSGEMVRPRSWIDALLSFFVQLLVWLILLYVAVKWEFGIVYCILTGFYLIWTNLGRRKKVVGEPSAYSVFNPNCERLPGQLTAEQIEAALMQRPM